MHNEEQEERNNSFSEIMARDIFPWIFILIVVVGLLFLGFSGH